MEFHVAAWLNAIKCYHAALPPRCVIGEKPLNVVHDIIIVFTSLYALDSAEPEG